MVLPSFNHQNCLHVRYEHIHPKRVRELNINDFRVGDEMATTNIEQKALGLLNAFENAGKSVSRVTIDGRKIEIVLTGSRDVDEYEGIDMRHGKT